MNDETIAIKCPEAACQCSLRSPRYRVGRHLGRTVYDRDILIGMMDTVELGQLVVTALNEYWETS